MRSTVSETTAERPKGSGASSRPMSMAPRILVTNDDGVEAAGIHILTAALHEKGYDVVVVAPNGERSGTGAGIGFFHPDHHLDAQRVEMPGCEAVEAYA